MTIANSFAAKASVAFVAIAMALSMVAPAQAQTAEELQAQIDTLMATIASLQAQLGTGAPTPSASAYVFTRSLTIGATGADVTALQTYLISGGYSIPAGATGYFGTQTQAAVAAWQAANGVAPAAGYFGPISQAKYNALMAAMPTPGGDDDDEDEDEDDSDFELSGEASLGDADLNDGDDTDIEEGQEAAPVAEFEVEFTDGDAKITRLDVELEATGSEEDPWDTFEEVSLWVDGDEVASMAADDEDDYLNDEMTLRFSGLDLIGEEDEPLTVVIAVTVQNGVDDLPATWNVDVTGMRFVDADGVNTTEDDAGIGVTAVDFDINEAGSDDEIIIKTSTEDPDASTLQVEDDTNSDFITVFAFDIDTDDSTNDIEFNTIRVGLQSGSANVSSIVNDLVLVIDGEEFDDWAFVDGTGTDTTVDFDIDGDLMVDAGDRVTAELQVEFKKLDGVNYSAGETIAATTTPAGWDAEGADDITPTGSATGETHTLRATGINVDGVETSAAVTTVDGATNDYGTFEIEFDVTAFESDIYISTNVATATTWEVQNGSGTDLSGTGTSTPTWSSSADENGAGTFFIVREGETETFTLEVTYLPGVTNQAARLQLLTVEFDVDEDVTPDQTWDASPVSTYRTQTKTIVN